MPRLQNMYAFLRYMMMLLSGVIFISGFVLLGLGVWIKYGASNFVEAMGSFSSQLVAISNVCIGVGGVLSLLGNIGFIGAWKENRFFIMVYFLIVSLMFIGEIIGTILVLGYKDMVEDIISGASKESLLTAYMGPTATDPISQAWNVIMINYKCCGFENSTMDFQNSLFTDNTGLLYPKTCCVDMTSPACDGHNTTTGLIHPESCMQKLISVIMDKSVIIGATAATVCVMELASMMVSVVLFVRLGSALY